MKKNIQIKKIQNFTLLIVLIQILLLVNFTFANSYIISSSYIKQKVIYEDKKINSISKNLFNLIIGFVSIKQVGVASATQAPYCCIENINGTLCESNANMNSESCKTDIIPTSCSFVSDCQIGCCIDEEEGFCSTQSTKKKCLDDGGIWDDSSECLIEECQKGCCVLGDNIEFVTEARCEKLSINYGFEKNFKDYDNQLYCEILKLQSKSGACVFEDKTCKFASYDYCEQLDGKFNADMLCSNPELNTTCERQSYISCIDEYDEIYWIDSCGNKENIYSSDKDFSWNNGFVLPKNESCNSDSANVFSSTCGNCNVNMGSICVESDNLLKKVEDGNFVCSDYSCIDEEGNKRLNGESWCSYESFIGEGKDTVGSRHWRQTCINGEVHTEPCADYRGEICVQTEIESQDYGDLSISACTVNEALNCFARTSGGKEYCEEHEHCIMKSINVDSGFKFDVCVGQYPRGFDLTTQSEEAQEICGAASQECIVTYVKELFGGWKCVQNCQCRTKKFTEQMSDLCISMGDCGSYVNYLGEGTDNTKVVNAPKTSWENYKEFAEKVIGQYATPKSIEVGVYQTTSSSVIELSEEKDSLSNSMTLLGSVSGGIGTTLMVLDWIGGSTLSGVVGVESVWAGTATPIIGTGTATTQGALGSGLVGPQLAAIGNAAAGLGIGVMFGSLASKVFGLEGSATTYTTLAGAIGGLAGGITATLVPGFSGVIGGTTIGGIKLSSALLTSMVWALVAVVVIAVLMKVFGIGDSMQVKVKFTCLPWSAPIGGEDCSKCNDDESKPCSKYKCESLGSACVLLNEDSTNPICEALPNDELPVIINIGEINEGFSFINTTDFSTKIMKGEECVPEFTPVVFSLTTNKYAQCKFDVVKRNNYNELEEYAIEQNEFSKNHTFAFSMPGLQSLGIYEVQTDIEKVLGDLNLYVMCQDVHGNKNEELFNVNFCISNLPDITPAQVVATNPANNVNFKYGTTNFSLMIFTNEPADCKYDSVDKEYELMSNNMECQTDLISVTDYGWMCVSNVNISQAETENFYIRCKDKPWVDKAISQGLDVNETRNVNVESFVYTINYCDTPLQITSISPSGIVYGGFEPFSVELQTKTSGGIDSGNSFCYYSFSNNDFIQFFETGSTIHKQSFGLMSGQYEIFTECIDEANNKVYENTSFTLDIDTIAPNVIRVYNEGNSINILTSEKSECYYTHDKCNFDFENATAMSSLFSYSHYADWNNGETYYIKCADIWGNTNPDCAIIVSPNSFM